MDLIMQEREVSQAIAERKLGGHKGDLGDTLMDITA